MADQQQLQITDAEWEVMLGVWARDDQTAGEIIARVDPDGLRSHRTIRKLLSRLVDKGAVTARPDGPKHRYRAAVTREACVHHAAESFSERFFSGSVKSMLMHFVEHESLSADEVEELKRRLEQLSSSSEDSTSSRKSSPRKKTRSRRPKS
jgi:BlaI family penicillinase repressor